MAAITSDFRTAPISEEERALLEFAVKLTRDPAASRKTGIEALRKVGWSDRAILDATLATAYFAFVNRIAQGLGVELEGGAEQEKD